MEIMVVVTIIGLVASIAIPAFTQSRQNSIAARMANDFRQFGNKFELYNLSSGLWPEDGYPGTIPSGMESHLNDGVWTQETGIGGRWDYDYNVFGFTAGVSIDSLTANVETLVAIDELLDDGNLNSGKVQSTSGNRLSYIIAD